MVPNYRNVARENLEIAKAHISERKGGTAAYAALHLRMAIEALSYERFELYKDEFPDQAYKTWQPRKLMQMMLDIDPLADTGMTLSIDLEGTPESPSGNYTEIGSEEVIKLSLIKENYDALGSYLHVPTISQLEKVKVKSEEKIWDRCAEISGSIDKILASRMFKLNMNQHTIIECDRCGAEIKRRMSRGVEERKVGCANCGAGYLIKPNDSGSYNWFLLKHEVTCPNEKCGEVDDVWISDISAGEFWTCPSCKTLYEFREVLRMVPVGEERSE